MHVFARSGHPVPARALAFHDGESLGVKQRTNWLRHKKIEWLGYADNPKGSVEVRKRDNQTSPRQLRRVNICPYLLGLVGYIRQF